MTMMSEKGKTVWYGQDKMTVLTYYDADARKRLKVLAVEKPDGTVLYRYESGHVEVMYQCLLCREGGKSLDKVVHFSSREDLNLHVLRLHGGYPNQGRT